MFAKMATRESHIEIYVPYTPILTSDLSDMLGCFRARFISCYPPLI